MKARIAAVGLLAALLAFPMAARAVPIVSSIAGNGRPDSIDGIGTAASFLMPAAVAVASDGSIVVADAAAQNIRRIVHGRVDTIAGASDRGASAESRTGGYIDGPARTARFSNPIGLAIAKDGAIFIADSGNNCIRRLAHGTVSTFAGSKTRGAVDAMGALASFEDIRAVAIDSDGNLYVADYGVGIRKIAPDGAVTTLNLAGTNHKVGAVAARGTAAHLVVAYSDPDALHIVRDGVDQAVATDGQREPSNSSVTVGNADAITIVNENTLVVCDVGSHAVRIVRFPALPFVSDTMTRALAGGIREGSDLAGGLADGPSETALVSVPLGTAIAPDGSIVVADAGNRRVRKISNVDFRESVLPDLSNLSFGKNAYNIAIVGNSYAFFNVLWPESIAGQIETGLARDRGIVRLGKRANLNLFRIDSLDERAMTTLVRNDMGDGQIDLLVLLANYYEPPDRGLLNELEHALAAKRTKLLVVFTPQGFETSPLEFWRADVAKPDYDYAVLREKAAREESYVQSLGARSLLLLDAMQREELSPVRRNFFYGADHHFTVYGTEWVGRQILMELERWRPWQ